MGSGLDLVELDEGSGLMKSGAHDLRRTVGSQMEFSGQGRMDHRDLRSGIQDEVVRAGVVDGDGHHYLVAVDETDRYTCHISGAVSFC